MRKISKKNKSDKYLANEELVAEMQRILHDYCVKIRSVNVKRSMSSKLTIPTNGLHRRS